MTRTKPPGQKRRKLRRTKFNGIKYKPSYLDKVARPGSMPRKWEPGLALAVCFLAAEGYTEKEIAEKIDVHLHTINYWKRHKLDFKEALEKGKQQYEERVEQSLRESAVGYSHPAIYFSNHEGVVTQTPYTKHYPPNVAAIKFYLTNRARNRWADIQQIDGVMLHKHQLDLTNLSMDQLSALESIGLVELPEHGSDTD